MAIDVNITSPLYQVTVSETPVTVEVNVEETAVTVTTNRVEIAVGAAQGPAGPPGSGAETIQGENKDTVSILKGMPVAFHSSGIGFIRASTQIGKKAIGVASEDMSVSYVGNAVSLGTLTHTDWTPVTGTAQLTPGAHYYLQDTPGTLATSDPTGTDKISQLVGIATSTTKLRLVLFPYMVKRS